MVRGYKVFVIVESNVVVDNIVERFVDLGLKVVRIGYLSRVLKVFYEMILVYFII